MPLPSLRERLLPWLLPVTLTVAVFFSFLFTVPRPHQEFYSMQAFIESLARGRLDFSILGFHGADFLAVPWYLLTRSPFTAIEVQIFTALFLPLAAFAAGRAIYKQTWHGLMLAAIISLMPFVTYAGLRGWTEPTHMLLLLLTITFAARGKLTAAGLMWGLALLTKPFALGLVPLLFHYRSKEGGFLVRNRAFLVAGEMVVMYLLLQFLQARYLLMGMAPGTISTVLTEGLMRMPANGMHALQILFSVHNYYFPDPALTGAGNLMHTTPLLVFLGLFGLLAQRQYYATPALGHALLWGILIAIGLNVPLDHMDHIYMEAGILLFVIAALPVLRSFPLWIPLVLATLHFQWFYFYLQYRTVYALQPGFFLVPALVDGIAIGWGVWAFWRSFKHRPAALPASTPAPSPLAAV
ncbi:MAG: hypothetical protein WCV62_02260 [Candidatus Peribacteraceae bacterium]|jgi:hypothetical protein